MRQVNGATKGKDSWPLEADEKQRVRLHSGAGMGAGQQGGQGGAHEEPGRNPGGRQQAGDKANFGGQQRDQQGGQKKPDKEGSYKEGGENEQTRR